ncbi:hypothetical protein AAMO2058_000764900 [Amorphochlora amoebiformis]
MGACSSIEDATPTGTSEERKRNRSIEKRMSMDQKVQNEVHKLLLLGAGESGKSTLFKQMYTLYGNGFDREVRESFVKPIQYQLLRTMRSLIKAADLYYRSTGDEKYLFPSKMPRYRRYSEIKLTSDVAKDIEKAWRHPAIQTIFEMKDNFQIPDCAEYFFDRVKEVSKPNYLPSNNDILRARARTVGVVENSFSIQDNKFTMYDVGGQRSERRKWVHCFEGVSCVLFVSAMSAFNQTLMEDQKTNRLCESLMLFDEICNSRWFEGTSLILFLNKRDIFFKKIQRFAITDCPALESFSGDLTDFQETSTFIKEEFLLRNKTNKCIYCHITCATDRANVGFVFSCVKDTVLKDSLERAGLVVDGGSESDYE